jgi:hypothetical protein
VQTKCKHRPHDPAPLGRSAEGGFPAVEPDSRLGDTPRHYPGRIIIACRGFESLLRHPAKPVFKPFSRVRRLGVDFPVISLEGRAGGVGAAETALQIESGDGIGVSIVPSRLLELNNRNVVRSLM